MFLKDCGRGECLGTTACIRTVVGGKYGHAPCSNIDSQIHLLCCLSFLVIIGLLQR